MSKDQKELVSEIFRVNPEVRKAFKDQIISSTQVTKLNKRHEKNRAAKVFARDIATTSWTEDNTQTIKELATYIQKMLVDDGHKKYSHDKVREWIKDLAPPERRKGGRPKKQPSKT